MSKWKVETRPVPENPSPSGKNESGVQITLKSSGGEAIEVSRVLFVRRNASNKSVGFKRQLLKELDKAYEAAEVLNDSYLDPAEKDAKREAQIEEADRRREQFLKTLQESENPRV